MSIIIRQISDRGTKNPIVARTTVQPLDLLQFSEIGREKDKKDEAFKVLLNFQRRLLVCDDIRQTIVESIEEINKDISGGKYKEGNIPLFLKVSHERLITNF